MSVNKVLLAFVNVAAIYYSLVTNITNTNDVNSKSWLLS
jgi:hypothetical protein